MARRKAKTRRRSKYTRAFNIRTAVLSYAGLSIFTNNVLGASPYTVLAAGYVPGFTPPQGGHAAGGTSKQITLNEILSGMQHGTSFGIGEAIWENATTNAGKIVMQTVGLKIIDSIITSTGAARNFNKVVRSLKLGQVVKA